MEGLSLSDEELAKSFAAGEDLHFEFLLGRYERKLFVFATLLLGSEEGAAKVLETVFVRACEELRKGFVPPVFRVWLFQQAVEICSETLYRDLIQEARNASRSVVVEKDPGTSLTIVNRAILRLPFEYRKIYVLRDVHSISLIHVAQVVGRSVEEADIILHRARLMLRRIVVREQRKNDILSRPLSPSVLSRPVEDVKLN